MPPNNYQHQPAPNPASYNHHKPGINKLLLPFVVSLLAAIGFAVFGVWAFGKMTDYKTNSDKKVSAAVAVAQQQTSTQKDLAFAEQEKSPYKTYKGPDTYGSISFQYSKKWSGFVTVSDNNSVPVDGYFHPDVVPGLQSGTAFALRLQVLNQSYDSVITQISNLVSGGKAKLAPYRAAKAKSVLGSVVTGAINDGQKDTMVILPLRDKTIEISTQSDQYLKDFTTIVMPSFQFSP